MFNVLGRMHGMSVKEEGQDISVDEVRVALESGGGLVLVDVRTVQEHERSHVPGDKLVFLDNRSVEELSGILKELAGQGNDIVLYCESGARSNMACGMLRSLGFNNLKSMTGGISAWQGQGYVVDAA